MGVTVSPTNLDDIILLEEIERLEEVLERSWTEGFVIEDLQEALRQRVEHSERIAFELEAATAEIAANHVLELQLRKNIEVLEQAAQEARVLTEQYRDEIAQHQRQIDSLMRQLEEGNEHRERQQFELDTLWVEIPQQREIAEGLRRELDAAHRELAERQQEVKSEEMSVSRIGRGVLRRLRGSP